MYNSLPRLAVFIETNQAQISYLDNEKIKSESESESKLNSGKKIPNESESKRIRNLPIRCNTILEQHQLVLGLHQIM